MKKITLSLLIAYTEGNLSDGQSKEIKKHLELYPYYKDILSGLQQLQEDLGEEEVIDHLDSKKQTARQRLFKGITA